MWAIKKKGMPDVVSLHQKSATKIRIGSCYVGDFFVRVE